MRTYWNVAVSVDGVTKCSTGDETLSKAIARGLSDAIYYQAIYPGSKVAITEVHESCAGCHNIGTVRVQHARSVACKRCPECHGKLAHGVVADIPLVMPDPANRITLAQVA